MDIKNVRMVDVASAEDIQVVLDADNKRVWVNIDGICLLRARLMPGGNISVIDNRTDKGERPNITQQDWVEKESK